MEPVVVDVLDGENETQHDPNYVCYTIVSADGLKTYVGITNKMTRRLRQHNGEISGGAKYTQRPNSRPWSIVFTIAGFRNKVEALQFEWAFHHTKGPRGLQGRVVKLGTLLRKRHWTRSAPLATSVPLCIQVYPGEHHDMLVSKLAPLLPAHCTLSP